MFKSDEHGVTRFDEIDEFSDSEFAGAESACSKTYNYEIFICGFFYFFVLQDPFVI